MQANIVKQLLAVNQEFYQTFAVPFSATRQRLQPGVQRLLGNIPSHVRMLDVGCGNGELARVLAQRGHSGSYLGVDFSPGLLAAAQAEADPEGQKGVMALQCSFQAVDLSRPGWADRLPQAGFDRIVAFAVLHHLPGLETRLALLKPLRRLLARGGLFFLSNWQFLNSPRLRQRIQPWSRIDLDETQVEHGDHLLDWRQGGQGLRYAHQFEPAELEALAEAAGFRVIETFYSDGAEGNLGLYQVWQ